MKALIVDDEPLLRVELRRMLARFPEMDVVGEAADAEEARRQLARLRPDVLFLDVHMPEESGLELLADLRDPPRVVFVTAYDQHAVDAFEFGAIDYLLKPVTEERLQRTVERLVASATATAPTAASASVPDAAQTTDSNSAPSSSDDENEDGDGGDSPGSAPATPLAEDQSVFLRDGDRCWFVPVRDIEALEACGHHVRVRLPKDAPIIHRSLGFLEARLPSRLFFRASRNAIVNIREVKAVEPWFSGGLRLTMRSGSIYELSRRQARRFRELTVL